MCSSDLMSCYVRGAAKGARPGGLLAQHTGPLGGCRPCVRPGGGGGHAPLAFEILDEGGEFDEIVKKMVFQGKPWNEDQRFHLMRELGDVAWYWVNACRAIGVDPNEVIEENVRKLEARYPGGKFDVHHSENRKAGDL